MSIWKYEAENSDLTVDFFLRRTCAFCKSNLQQLPIKAYRIGSELVTDCWRPSLYGDTDKECAHALCTTCGWW
jgi:hypothetical protein